MHVIYLIDLDHSMHMIYDSSTIVSTIVSTMPVCTTSACIGVSKAPLSVYLAKTLCNYQIGLLYYAYSAITVTKLQLLYKPDELRTN